MTQIIHLVAATSDGYIGIGDELPFSIPEDLKNFKALTHDALICMGNNTFESILANYTKKGKAFLPNRKVTVVCSTDDKAAARNTKYKEYDNVIFLSEKTFMSLVHRNRSPIIIVGGSRLYRTYSPHLVLMTSVNQKVLADSDELVVEIVDGVAVDTRKSDGKVLYKYPFFARLPDMFELPFKTQTSVNGLEYTYKIYYNK